MQKAVIICIVLVLSATSCRQQSGDSSIDGAPKETRISGTIGGGADVLVTLDRMGASAFEPVDSVRCDRRGRFSFEFSQSEMNYYALKYTEQGYVTLALHPGDEIVFSGNDTSVHPYKVDGSEASALIAGLSARHKDILEQLRNISIASQQVTGRPDYSRRKLELNRRFDSITDSFTRYSREFIHRHAPSPAILPALYNLYGPGLPVFDPLEDLAIYRFVDSVLFDSYNENEAVKALHSQLHAALQQIRMERGMSGLETGIKAPDFVLSDINGSLVSLREFRGQHVLLHFWASWSKPSLDEYRNLAHRLESYGSEALVVLMVSLDDEAEKWKEGAGSPTETIIHVSDLKRWDSPVAELYQVDRIPTNFLINPEGIIIEKNIFGQALEETLEKYHR